MCIRDSLRLLCDNTISFFQATILFSIWLCLISSVAWFRRTDPDVRGNQVRREPRINSRKTLRNTRKKSLTIYYSKEKREKNSRQCEQSHPTRKIRKERTQRTPARQTGPTHQQALRTLRTHQRTHHHTETGSHSRATTYKYKNTSQIQG